MSTRRSKSDDRTEALVKRLEDRSHSKNARRMRSGIMSSIVLVATLATVVMANLIATRYSMRVDVTQTRQHELTQGTLDILQRLEDSVQSGTSAGEAYELVLAIDPSARTVTGSPMIHPRALQTVRSIVREMNRKASDLKITEIDVGRAQGEVAFQDLLDRLLERDADALTAQVKTVRDAAAGLGDLAVFFTTPVTERIMAIANELDPADPEVKTRRDGLVRLPETFSTAAANYRVAVERTNTQLPETFDRAWPLPPVDEAITGLVPTIEKALADLDLLIKTFNDRSESPEYQLSPQRLFGELADVLIIHRDALAKHADALKQLRAVPLLSVGRMIESQQAVLLIGPRERGLVAIDFDTLFPPAEVIESAQGASVDLRLRSEELLSSALGTLVDPIKPVVVLVHCDDVSVLGQQSAVSAAIQRLRSRSIDVLEWPVVSEPHPPSLADIDPSGDRPVVFIVQSSFAASQSVSTSLKPEERFAKLGDAVSRLVREGESILMNLQPSTLPALGGDDPMVAALPLFGLTADTAKPIMTQRMTAEGRDVLTDHLIRVDQPTGKVDGAIQGLETLLLWPVPLRPATPLAADHVDVHPLLRMTQDGAWAESMWVSYFRTPRELRSTVAEKPASGDVGDDTSGPFLVAASSERRVGATNRIQRMIVVGSAGWFMDSILRRTAFVDGREIPAFAGNAELLEASVLWLANQDDRIAQSPAARTTPRIKPLATNQLLAIRWLVLVGAPLVVLVFGAAWRLIRG
ncbi:MAG: hypothetical protein H6815_08605 [Phycisphaeraceae bacterium]|nr:hypothetical protein [Phycisphaerales bacterium]MCB9860502.1 hypothetical protein [Phycisphaeraceae bacterium]